MGFGVWGLGFGVWGLGFGFRVSGRGVTCTARGPTREEFMHNQKKAFSYYCDCVVTFVVVNILLYETFGFRRVWGSPGQMAEGAPPEAVTDNENYYSNASLLLVRFN